MNQHLNVYSAIYNNKRETIKVFFESSDIGDFNYQNTIFNPYQNLIWVIDEQNNKMLVRRADLVGIRFEIGGCEETTELINRVRNNNNTI
jgi:hypothetical protein